MSKMGIKVFLWLIVVLGAFTLLNFKIAMHWSSRLAQENGNLSTITSNKPARFSPLIFIGGMPRSGTTLMLAMLASHPDVKCIQETGIIPFMLHFRMKMYNNDKKSNGMWAGGVTENTINSAFAKFILEIIDSQEYAAPRLCYKDSAVLTYGAYMLEIFPKAKFLLMIRDGRAAVHSIISRNISTSGITLKNYRYGLIKWNKDITEMYDECKFVGKSHCMMVYYEQLVLEPKKWLQNILNFLNLPWHEAVLHHEEFVNKPGGVNLLTNEYSADQFTRPIFSDSLTTWVNHIPDDVLRDMAELAPMLSTLGYDVLTMPPDYKQMKIVHTLNKY